MSMPTATGPDGGCPGRDTLIDFDLGRLSDEEIDALDRHLASCERCRAVLETLQGQNAEDDVIGAVREYLGVASPPIGPGHAGTGAGSETLSASGSDPDLEPGGTMVQRDEPGLPPGEVRLRSFGPYQVQRILGWGGMGIVYLARQVPLERTVALKMILAGAHADRKAVARFFREVKALARVPHPNVVQAYESGRQSRLPYLAMEYVDGGGLRAKLAAGPLDPRAAAELVRTLAGAVQFAHEKGVVHRDLKPSNILLCRDGTPKISDFGLAKLSGPSPDGVTMTDVTQPNAPLGTPCYMSPEQANGSVEIGPATDVYALGAILYECLTGRPPFVGKTKAETLEWVRSPAQPAPPSSVRPEVPSWLGSVCLKCLEKSPALRYPSAQELADDLGRWLSGEQPVGVPTWLTRVDRAVRRNLTVVLKCLALISVGTAVIAVEATTADRANPGRVIQQVQSDLALGRTVTLIGKTGQPVWSQWRRGRSETFLADDGTFSINSWSVSLLELLPDPRCESYRINAQVRHDRSDLIGQVGIYFALRGYPWGPGEFQFLSQVVFNDVRGDADRLSPERLERIPEPIRSRLRPQDNVVVLESRLVSDQGVQPSFDSRFGATGGPRFKPHGERNGLWHDLEVTVTPGRVTARWDGQAFSRTPSEIQKAVNLQLTSSPIPLAGPFRPQFSPRGGLGLLLWKGSASFRSVTVTPL
jgi:serine/threonine-protein kinase